MLKVSNYFNNSLKFILAALTALICIGQVGCASGGYSLTRKYARFVNKQNIIIRIVLYILTGVVFAVTLLIDAVIFNTIDFWEGKVSAGDYQFDENNKTYSVKHYFSKDTKLRNSEIKIFSQGNNKLIKSFRLAEIGPEQIEVYEDNQLKAVVDDISKIPKLSVYKDGQLESVTKMNWLLEKSLVAKASN